MNDILPHDNRLPETVTPAFLPVPHKIIMEKWECGKIIIGAKYMSKHKISGFCLSGGYTIDEAVENALLSIEKWTNPVKP
ncbi:hypothetical protein I5M32_11345 [Pedobacter sp. SD-b]|uniref:Uncharacterized protein n=1 Tax=Pedobacter segetis TaxID=2793069 RepID=A0ABS1BKY7_9SPHI|nr:hypothetical protein [Pedobacter segetis]MBK0383552.1 hypothetical protein [Pedobacter segetis]